MSARVPRERPARAVRRPGRRTRWLAALLGLVVIAAGTGWLVTRSHGAAAPAPARSALADPVIPRDPGKPVALPTTPPAAVPAAVLAPAPGLPPAVQPVALASTSDLRNGMRARLVEVRSVDAHARIPGEVSGPALRVTVELTNTTASPASLDRVAVNLYTGSDGVPAVPVTEQAGPALHGSLAPGASARGTYAFTVPVAQRGEVTVTVGVGPQIGTAVFSGAVR